MQEGLIFTVETVVLIVAKCIVNHDLPSNNLLMNLVLIVAKCIVNRNISNITPLSGHVLIVAKCIVNIFMNTVPASFNTY